MEYRIIRSDDYLAHHGVLGMKWGVRKKEDLVGRRPGVADSQNVSYNKDGFHLSDKQKKYIKIGAVACASALAIYGGYKLKKYIDLKDLKGVANITKVDPNSIDPKSINPFMYSKNLPLSTLKAANMNCGNCAIANELRYRGIPVQAKLNGDGMYPEQMMSYFTGQDADSIVSLDVGGPKAKETIIKTIIDKYPDNARGSIYLPRSNDANHFQSWQKLNGEVFFEDTQNTHRIAVRALNTVVSSKSGSIGAKRYGTRIMRLDNLGINQDTINDAINKKNTSLRRASKTRNNYNATIIKGENFVMKTIDENGKVTFV